MALKMKQTEQTLLEQMRITEFEIEYRKELFFLTESDAKLLKEIKPTIEQKLDTLVTEFYEMQTSIPEIALLIGDADTLRILQSAQHRYILDLFSGVYDLEYVNNRLRIGLVHKRIGVEPKLYLAAVNTLKRMLVELLHDLIPEEEKRIATQLALQKLFMFDIALVFETYIRSLVSEIETSKQKSEQYACLLEEKVKERTQLLEEKSRTDPLTGLLNVRYLNEILTQTLRAAQRRSEPISIVYIDINDFKMVNDTQGHQYGDRILRIVGAAIKNVSRIDDHCFRYGGDEFCLVLPNCTKEEAQEVYLKRLNEDVKRNSENISLSIGIVQTGPHQYAEPDKLIHMADENMYAEKKSYKLNLQS
jgi:diguanylate cyclase (GGDEF)-like protein